MVSLGTGSEWLQLLAQSLEALRRVREMTQQDLADQSGLNRETIGRIERGLVRTKLQQSTVSALAAAFGYATLSQFWEALQRARDTAIVRGSGTLALDVRTYRILTAFQELSPIQKDLVEAVVTQLLANIRAQRTGEESLCNLPNFVGLTVPSRRR